MAKIGFTVPLGKGFTVQPVAQYWFPLSGNAAHKQVDGFNYQQNGRVKPDFVYGLNLGFTF
jgi:hypothetical protein